MKPMIRIYCSLFKRRDLLGESVRAEEAAKQPSRSMNGIISPFETRAAHAPQGERIFVFSGMMGIVSAIMAACLLSGCLSSVKLTPQTNYMLNATPDVASYHTRPLTLLVLTPETESAYDTMQMAYALHSYQIAYYDKNRWAETPGQMLQALMVRTLQNTHYFRAVLTPPTVGRYQYVLMTRILQLKHDYTHLPVMARLTVRAQLVRVATNQVVATQEFTMSQPMRQHTPFGGVVAANRATADFLIALTQFCVQQAR